MDTDRNSYSNIIKATALFGGVKVLQIFISLFRAKLIAVLLGPTGMGIAGLITSSTNIIGSLTGFGLGTSAVRDVSQAHTSGDEDRKNTTITVLRFLVLLTGIVGSVMTFLLSPYLSNWAFGNNNYSYAFKIVSVILIFNQLYIGQTVLLQGTFRYKSVAKSSLYGSLFGLIFTIPLYYIWGIDGIVPAIILASIIQLLLSWNYSRKVPYKKISLTLKQLFVKGKVMLTLGLVIALTGFATQGNAYLLNIFISNFGSVEDVGLHTAGVAMASMYVGMVLGAMGTDYSPRLAAAASNGKEIIEVINKQALLLVTVLAPLIILFIVFIKPLIILLYSTKFIAITGMIEWVMLGMFFRAVSWSISFSFIARGDSKIFFWNEIFAAIYYFGLSAIGYYAIGLSGLGIGFLITYLLYTIQVYLLAYNRFHFTFKAGFLKIFLIQIFLATICFIMMKLLGYNTNRYLVGVLFLGLISWISYKSMNKMISIPKLIEDIKSRIFR